MSLLAVGGPVGGGAAQHAAKAELSRPEYHRDDPGPISRFLHWLWHQIGKLFTGGAGGHALLIVLVVLLAVVIVFAVRAALPGRVARVEDDPGLDPLASVPARDHRRIAEQLSAEGRRAEALREWLRAAVATIEERGVLPPRPGRTGASTAREAGPLLPTAADELRDATRAFDEVWFGGRTASDADVALAKTAADAVAKAHIVADAVPSGFAVPR